jgi:hypothetical protein
MSNSLSNVYINFGDSTVTAHKLLSHQTTAEHLVGLPISWCGGYRMIDLSSLDAKEVIREDDFSEYDKGMEFFFLQLVRLNETIFIADQIVKAPLHFVEPNKKVFFNVVLRNFFDAGLLIITRLATDQGKDLYTLTHFKNRVRELVRPEYVGAFTEKLKRNKFDTRTAALLERARNLRDERVGHTIRDVALGEADGAHLDFSELKSLRDALNLLLKALSFNADHMMLPIPYDPRVQHPKRNNYKTDIEELLDYIISNSVLLNAPERNPALWEQCRTGFAENDVELINRYRKKYGLSSV